MSPVQFEPLVRCPGKTPNGDRCHALIEPGRALCDWCQRRRGRR